MCGINTYRINAGLHECIDSLLKISANAHCRSTAQTATLILRGMGMLCGFQNIFDSNQTHQGPIAVDKRQLLQAMLTENCSRLRQCRTHRSGDQRCSRHKVSNRTRKILGFTKTGVAVRQNANKFALSIDDRNTRNMKLRHDVFGILQCCRNR
ncbi:unannotated protein [freshwater metagenome]|uniref:Unannotated protein n=1 Tax=freshwater metagenome TaxID=449393 RepID=A0A6J6CIF2_9ZZZZ